MRTGLVVLAMISVAAASGGAQAPQGRGGRGLDPGVERLRAFDPAAVERGRSAFGEKCSTCHRANARGGQGFTGPDLLRSVLVLQDVNGRQIGALLQTEHKPPIPVAPQDISDIS